MKYTLSEAAAEVGLSKTSIHKAVKSGRLSAVRDGRRYQIDASELFRVYPKNVNRNDNERQLSLPVNDVKDVEIRMLREQLDAQDEHHRAMLALQQDRIDDLNRLLISKSTEPVTAPISLWRRLFGK